MELEMIMLREINIADTERQISYVFSYVKLKTKLNLDLEYWWLEVGKGGDINKLNNGYQNTVR